MIGDKFGPTKHLVQFDAHPFFHQKFDPLYHQGHKNLYVMETWKYILDELVIVGFVRVNQTLKAIVFGDF